MNIRLAPTLRASTATMIVATLAACAGAPAALAPGASIAEARSSRGASGEYRLADGGTRLEYRQGRETWMLDFDASGRLVDRRQVLNPQSFGTIVPGMTQDDVLARIGHPAFSFGIGWQQSQVWNYRFSGLDGDCVVFQVSIRNVDRTVSEAGPNTDPACDHASERS